MRTVSSEALGALTNVRTINGYAVVRDNRLRFTERDTSHDSPLPNLWLIDSYNYGTGILRVANAWDIGNGQWSLYYQYVSNPEMETQWPAWVNTARALKEGSVPGVYEGRLFYQGSNNTLYRADFNGSTLSAATSITGGTAMPAAIAPVSLTEFYLMNTYVGTVDGYSYIYLRNTSGSLLQTWPGRVYYTSTSTPTTFDAERLNGVDYIYVVDKDDRRTWALTQINGAWSEFQPLIPMDIVDDESLFRMAGVAQIDGKLFITGKLYRSYGSALDVYTIGPDNYTMGRDMYVWPGNGKYGGKLHLVGNKLWYVGNKAALYSDATMIVGVDNAARKVTLNDINNIKLTQTSNKPASLNFEVPSSETHSAIRSGSHLELYANLGGYDIKLGEFGIDMVSRMEDGSNGEALRITATGWAGKSLTQWRSDASYDLWSQAKQTSNPVDLTKLIRFSGQWDTTGDAISLEDLNKTGVLNSSAMSSSGAHVRARFKKGAATGKYGVMLNFGTESYQTAKDRLGREPAADDYIHGGILVVAGDTEHNDGPGIAVYNWLKYNNGTQVVESMNKLTSYSQSIATDVWHWIAASFHMGEITVMYRLNSSTTWTRFTPIYFEDGSPWIKEDRGRGGLVMLNSTNNQPTPGFSSSSNVIPVDSMDGLSYPSNAVVKVDNELILHYDQSYTVLNSGDFVSRYAKDGSTLPNAPHDNTYWDAGRLAHQNQGLPYDQNIGYSTSNRYVGRTFTTLATIGARIAQFRVMKVGSPGNLYCYLCTDAIDDSATFNETYVIASTYVTAASVGTSFDTRNFDFGLATLQPANYWLVLSMTPPGGPEVISSTNYYVLEVDEDNVDSAGILRILGASWAPRTPNAAVYFELYGAGGPGNGYEIYFSGFGPEGTRSRYNDAALVVTDGPGKGSVFQITDYDWKAPKYWKPNRSYLPPDTWQDHIGDLAHGSWMQASEHRIFVAENPRSLIGPTSVCKVYYALHALERGYNSTTATSHSAGLVSRYQTGWPTSDMFDYHSNEMEMRFEDTAREICTKAGVLDVSFEKHIDETLNWTQTGWQISTNMTATKKEVRNPIFKFTINSGTEVGVALNTVDGTSGGRIVSLTTTYLNLYEDVQTRTLVERVPIVTRNGEITISVEDEVISVYIGGRFIHAFSRAFTIAGSYAGFVSNGSANFTVDWSVLDRRVDNFLLDAGKSGMDLLDRLVGEKHFYFRDTQDGGIYFLRNKTPVNTGSPYVLTTIDEGGDADTNTATRIRIEGAGLGETYNATAMKENGNLFILLNMSELNTDEEALKESQFLLNELLKRRNTETLMGAADPRIEADDQIYVTLPAGTTLLNVDEIGMMLEVSESGAIFDMNIRGHQA